MSWRRFQHVIWALLAVCAGGIALLLQVGDMWFVLKEYPMGVGRITGALILVFILLLFVWGDGAIVRVARGWERAVALIFALAAEGLFLMTLLFFMLFGDCGTRFVPLAGPEDRPTLVAMEESWLQGGWGRFYWQVNLGRLWDTGVTYITDDGYRPFERGHYELEWGEDSVTVHFDTSAGWDSCVVPLP